MAKVVLGYQHRATEPSFTVVIKDSHLITFTCKRTQTGPAQLPPPQPNFRFGMTLHVLSSYMNPQQRTPHALEFVMAPGAHDPFPDCEFKWTSPDEAL
jgi:hypothetical protein